MSIAKTLSCVVLLAATASWLLFVPTAHAGGISFINRSIWYHPDPFFVGQTVRIYAGILNTSARDAYGTIELFVRDESIGTVNFAVRGGGNVAIVWRDWQASAGEVVFAAKVTRVVFTSPGEPDEEVTLPETSAHSSITVFVDTDTDGDGIGDRDDPVDDRPDSDGDGIPDAEDSNGGQSRPAVGQFIDVAQSVEQKIDTLLRSLAEKLRTLKEKSGRDDSGDSGIKYDRNASVDTDTIVLDTDSLPPEQLLDIRMSLEGGKASVQESGVVRFFKYLYTGILAALVLVLENRFFRYGAIIALLYLMLRRRRAR